MNNFKLKAKTLKGKLFKSVATSVLALSAVTGALMAVSGSASAQVAPPFGSSVTGQNKNIFYFTPWGAQLDLDATPEFHVPITNLSANPQIISNNIYDIEIGSNTLLDFDLYLYTAAPQYDTTPKQLNSFKFLTHIDPSEYQFGPNPLASFSFNPAFINACGITPPTGNAIDGELACNFSPSLNVTNNPNFLNPILLGTFHGKTIVPGPSPHDGVRDFKLDLSFLKYSDNTDVAMVNGQFQDVEVQQVPGPLPILGAAAAFRFCRKARKLSARNKTV